MNFAGSETMALSWLLWSPLIIMEVFTPSYGLLKNYITADRLCALPGGTTETQDIFYGFFCLIPLSLTQFFKQAAFILMGRWYYSV